ncbi:MAG: prepilin-type N-terminal cleavage/methylation domain-containing protein [Sedimentisphaerales bacterium]
MSSLAQKIKEKSDIRYQRRGSTLIEVMLAIAILIIAIFGTSSTFVTGRKFIVSQQHYQAAAHLASQKIEQIKANAYTDVNEMVSDEQVSMYGCNYTRNTQIQLTATPTANVPKPCKKVTVTIGWTGSAEDAHQVKLVTYIGP